MKHILITGLTGTSGSAFYDVLCREHCLDRLRVIVRKTTDLSIFQEDSSFHPNVELVTGDISDKGFLKQALQGCDTVFHIASKRMIQPLADAITEVDSVKDVIMVSSTIIYSKYYRTSYLGEDEALCIEKFKRRGVKYLFLRPTMIFGLPNDGNISRFIRWFLKYPVFPIVGKGQATIQPVSRHDLAEAYWLGLKNFSHIKKTEYIVSGERPMTLLEMFEIVCRNSGKKVCFINVPFPIAKLCVEILYILTRTQIDYREKLDRLMEDRAYPHNEISMDLGYAPRSFEERVSPLIQELKGRT